MHQPIIAYVEVSPSVSPRGKYIFPHEGELQDSSGERIGSVKVVSTWRAPSYYSGWHTWMSVSATIDGVAYFGRFNWDTGSAVKLRAYK